MIFFVATPQFPTVVIILLVFLLCPISRFVVLTWLWRPIAWRSIITSVAGCWPSWQQLSNVTTLSVRISSLNTPHHSRQRCAHFSNKMFSTFTNFIWGENQEEETGALEQTPGAREVEDWIVVGATPNDLETKKENSANSSPTSPRSNSKQKLKSLMFGENSSGRQSQWNSRSKTTGWQNQQYKQNLNFKTAGNRNLKQC